MSQIDPSGATLTEVFRDEWPRLVGAAMRITADLAAAEDVVQETLLVALDRWPLTGVPDNPAAWLMTACRNRARNHVRDAARSRARDRSRLVLEPAAESGTDAPLDGIPDDRLRLIFMCCHPVLPTDAQVALTLRAVGGLATVEIANAFLVSEAAMAQRIHRAKRLLAEDRPPFDVPMGAELGARLPAVLEIIYLIFNEGYLASSGASLTRRTLATEAARLAGLLTELLPDEAETWALRALICFHLSREATRIGQDGQLVTLENQDRSRWDQLMIRDGLAAFDRALRARRCGALTVQARIARCHAVAPEFADTDWSAIVACYDELLAIQANAVIELNRAVAVAMANGPRAALPILDSLANDPVLSRGHRLWAIRAELHRRSGDIPEAVDDCDQALRLVDNDVERRHLTQLRQALTKGA
jgi:RNA polymerase sigma-70 factor (ECF subfamily)